MKERFTMRRVRGYARSYRRNMPEEEKAAYYLEAKRKREERKARKIAEQEEADAKIRATYKPCPFCGCDLPSIPYPGDISAFVQCPRCDATGPSVTDSQIKDPMARDALATARWNARKP